MIEKEKHMSKIVIIGAGSGFGARLDFGLVLIRFDLGVRLYDPYQGSWMGINDWFTGDYAFHFGIGYPF